mgnify:CR=1 FL=1
MAGKDFDDIRLFGNKYAQLMQYCREIGVWIPGKYPEQRGKIERMVIQNEYYKSQRLILHFPTIKVLPMITWFFSKQSAFKNPF